MNALERDAKRKGAFRADPSLARRVTVKRFFARLVLFAERLLPLFLPALGIAAIFLSLAWFGIFRMLPDWLRLGAVFVLVFALVGSLLPLFKVRWPKEPEADRLLEERNGLPHEPVAVQGDAPAFDSPFAKALWEEHQRRMARRIADLDAGLPKPDIARFDKFALRAVPALLVTIAFAYSGSNGAGTISDAFYQSKSSSTAPDLRIDAWITPPGYTAKAPVFLTGRDGTMPQDITVPQASQVTVRMSGGDGDESVVFKTPDGEPLSVPVQAPAQQASVTPPQPGTPMAARAHEFKLEESGSLQIGDRQWQINVTTDQPPQIAFDGEPRRAANGALEIAFKATDDYGLQAARAEISLVDATPGATPLYPPPEYKLDLPRHNAKEAKGLSSRNLTEHPMAGKQVSIVLVARDGSGQEGRSEPHVTTMPARNFFQLLAGAVAEQRQVFSLDTGEIERAIELSEALTLRPEETIKNLTHYLLIESARSRMMQARTDEDLKNTADYLWEIALGIEDGDLSLAERRLRDAQQALQDALERNAPDEEIAKLMDELRQAMQEFMQALAERMQNAEPGQPQQQAQNVLRQQDLENMLNQIENLARSGNRDQAMQMLSELQRMMNNLQAGRPQQGGQQQQQNSQMREQIDKLGELMQEQQRLMDETFGLDQALRDRMQRGDPGDGEDGEFQDQQQQQGGQQQSPTDQMTAEQLREALKNLRAQQDGLGEKLKQLQEGLKGMGIEPGDQFGEAGREMQGAGESLGEGEGGPAVEGQGRAMEALRQGARDMMNQMMQAMQQQQGEGQGEGQNSAQGGQNGRDPLGRPRQSSGPDFGERVDVPDEIDVQRAREILEQIRRKLGEGNAQEFERRYLERLLDL